MPFTTAKISGAFPEVAIIRKGEPKRKVTRNGREVEVVGPDLNDKFRVVFHPGTDKLAEAFLAKYETYQPKVIRAMLPFGRAIDCWEAWNEAYSAGRLIAKADGEHYISKRNPLTGAYEVRDGEPFTPWEVGDVITYEGRNGGQIALKFRTTGRLKLFLPYTIAVNSARFVHFLLKTTSFYDCLNIESNLLAIQNIANTLNHGNAAGIPLVIYRRPTDIVWNHADGGASREKKWLVYIEADPEWVADAMARMKSLADGKPINLLPSGDPGPIVANDGAPDPTQEDDYDPEEGDTVDGEYSEAPEASAADDTRTPDQLRAALLEEAKKGGSPDQKIFSEANGCLDYILRSKGARMEFLNWLNGSPVKSSKDMQPGLFVALHRYLAPAYDENGAAYYPQNEHAQAEITAAHTHALEASGQKSLL